MKAMLIKTERGLRGATDDDHAAWVKFRQRLEVMKPGGYIKVETARPRNPGHHRKFFALLRLVSDNSEVYNTKEKALTAIKLVTGYADPLIDPRTGGLLMIPRSISYESMDQDKFDEFYSQAIDGILQHILPHMTRTQMDRLIDIIISGWA